MYDFLLNDLNNFSSKYFTDHNYGTFFESLIFLMNSHQHNIPNYLQICNPDLSEKKKFYFSWNNPANLSKIKNSYKDEDESTRDGAIGLSLLIYKDITKFNDMEKYRKKDKLGFDFYLKNDDDIFLEKSFGLEVTGIFKGTKNNINTRLNIKRNQVQRAINAGYEIFIFVFEFSQLKCIVEKL